MLAQNFTEHSSYITKRVSQKYNIVLHILSTQYFLRCKHHTNMQHTITSFSRKSNTQILIAAINITKTHNWPGIYQFVHSLFLPTNHLEFLF